MGVSDPAQNTANEESHAKTTPDLIDNLRKPVRFVKKDREKTAP
jgi:hypothetical protein